MVGQGKSWGISRRIHSLWWAVVAVMVAGCSLDGLLKSDELPPGVSDPALTQTPDGALAAYRGALAWFRTAFGVGSSASATSAFVPVTGLLSDELNSTDLLLVDLRSFSESGNFSDDNKNAYSNLQQVRGQVSQAIGLLNRYRPQQPELVGHMYALEAYTEVFLAEFFCSGIPLSTLDFDGDYTYRPGSSTEEVFTHALALFDSAQALAGDSTRFRYLAAVGKARALLALGEYAQAAAAVAAVPDDYRYEVSFSGTIPTTGSDDPRNFARVEGSVVVWEMTVADHEGGNGLDYRTSGDPRTEVNSIGTSRGITIWHPTKYTTDGSSPIVLASGIEARLIEAEAALHAGDVTAWLAKLNALRTDGTNSGMTSVDTIADTLGVTGCGTAVCGDGLPDANFTTGGGTTPEYGQPAGGFPVPAGYSLADSVSINPVSDAIRDYCYSNSWYLPCYVDVNNPQNGQTTVYLYTRPGDTVWAAGTGGVANLAPLTDPGTAEARVDLLFRERAFWLFLTGHRQGDLRRLIRQYGRRQEQIYPTGIYVVGGTGAFYGSDVTAPIPSKEQVLNPLFTGCFTRSA